jgi:3D (Asp-Asp-Asp) domain-containing protein
MIDDVVRWIARALRHGLVVASVCVVIALLTGVSGYVFGDRPVAAHGQVPPVPVREAAGTSTEVLERWLKPSLDVPAEVAPLYSATPIETPTVVTIESATTGVGLPEDDGPVAAARSSDAVVALHTGDRTVVSVSFYYCQQSRGSFATGDGGGFCGIVRDGSLVRSGVAACDMAYLGQKFQIEGDPTHRTYLCADTGSAVHGLHRDIWFMENRDGWDWQRSVGAHAVIRIVP